MASDVGSTTRREFSDDDVMRLAAEWRSLTFDDAASRTTTRELATDEWEVGLAVVASEYEALRAAGRWVSGPDDLFAVVGLARSELHHSAMLAWLFDPNGRHGLGRRFLDSFSELCGLDESTRGVRVRSVETEVQRGDTRADLVVWGDAFTLVVENKVDAGEQPNQCSRLWLRFRDEPGAAFVFLTPTGRMPVTATGGANGAFIAVSYAQLRPGLLRTLELSPRAASGRGVAEDYLRTLEVQFG